MASTRLCEGCKTQQPTTRFHAERWLCEACVSRPVYETEWDRAMQADIAYCKAMAPPHYHLGDFHHNLRVFRCYMTARWDAHTEPHNPRHFDRARKMMARMPDKMRTKVVRRFHMPGQA